MSKTCDFIVDYEENEEDIERWFSIKCKEKYRAFAELFPEKRASWKEITDLYRYDRRLIFNCFKYISFLEEFLRAKIIRTSDDIEDTYDKWQEKYIVDFKDKNLGLKNEDIELINKLRNSVCHDHIIIEKKNYKKMIRVLYASLPKEYKNKFKKTMIDCKNDLKIDDKWCFSENDFII